MMIVSTLQELGQSVLMCAAECGYVSVIMCLVEAGAELDLQDTEVCYQRACFIIHSCMIVHNIHACRMAALL